MPTRAKVIVDGTYNDISEGSPDHGACDKFRTTPRQIRNLFRISLEIDGPEHHGGMDEVACGVAGHILLDGKRYQWQLVQSDPAGMIETDFPDGVSKILVHQIGDSSDEPHSRRPGKYIDLRWWKQ
ncbi:hypothetical protein [Terriglobus sp.]|uniref:hypothetical protein n=1 Tax=Terriglobus sp. TaxID=1889013 RepID=UPI003AFF78AE